MQQLFQRYIGIDYSGGDLPNKPLPGIQAYVSEGGTARRVGPPANPRGNWSRVQLAEWLAQTLSAGTPTIVGVDHCFSFPKEYLDRMGVATWDRFLREFTRRFPTAECRVRDTDRSALPVTGLRMTERWTSSARSVFDFGPNGVAFSSFAGLPWLLWLRRRLGERLHFWPYDGWLPPAGKSVICEMYPAMLKGRVSNPERLADHKRDAHAVASWLAERDALGFLRGYFQPPLTDAEQAIAEREGWILGVM